MRLQKPRPPRYDHEYGQYAYNGKWYDAEDIGEAVEETEAAYEMYWDARMDEAREDEG